MEIDEIEWHDGVYSGSGISIYWDDPKKIIELRPDKDTSNDPSWSFKKALQEHPRYTWLVTTLKLELALSEHCPRTSKSAPRCVEAFYVARYSSHEVSPI